MACQMYSYSIWGKTEPEVQFLQILNFFRQFLDTGKWGLAGGFICFAIIMAHTDESNQRKMEFTIFC